MVLLVQASLERVQALLRASQSLDEAEQHHQQQPSRRSASVDRPAERPRSEREQTDVQRDQRRQLEQLQHSIDRLQRILAAKPKVKGTRYDVDPSSEGACLVCL